MAKEASTFFDLSNENVETPGLKPLELEIEDSPAEKMPSKNPFLRYRHFYQVDYRRQRKKLFILGILIFDVCLFLAARFFLSKPNFYYFGRMIMFLMFEVTLFLASIFIYKRITDIFDKSSNEGWQKYLSIATKVFAIIWIIFAHISWLFYNLSIPSDFFFPVLW